MPREDGNQVRVLDTDEPIDVSGEVADGVPLVARRRLKDGDRYRRTVGALLRQQSPGVLWIGEFTLNLVMRVQRFEVDGLAALAMPATPWEQ